jgi:hypothetical protein
MELIITTPETLRFEVEAAVSRALANQQPRKETIEQQKQHAYSIKEGADFFKCSPVTFQRWKNEGYVKYVQHGRKLVIDLQGTLELLNTNKKRV